MPPNAQKGDGNGGRLPLKSALWGNVTAQPRLNDSVRIRIFNVQTELTAACKSTAQADSDHAHPGTDKWIIEALETTIQEVSTLLVIVPQSAQSKGKLMKNNGRIKGVPWDDFVARTELTDYVRSK